MISIIAAVLLIPIYFAILFWRKPKLRGALLGFSAYILYFLASYLTIGLLQISNNQERVLQSLLSPAGYFILSVVLAPMLGIFYFFMGLLYIALIPIVELILFIVVGAIIAKILNKRKEAKVTTNLEERIPIREPIPTSKNL